MTKGKLHNSFGIQFTDLEIETIYVNGHEFEQTLEMVKAKVDWNAVVHGVAESDTTEQ